MPRAQRGQRFGGRQKGSANKRTVARLLTAQQEIADARKKGHKQAITVLDDLMHTAAGYAALYQTKLQRWDAEQPGIEPPPELVERFWLGMNSAGTFAKALAPYQTPKIGAIQPTPPPPDPLPGDYAKLIEGKELKIKDPIELSRIYHKLVRAE
jgi:hypothetical protein